MIRVPYWCIAMTAVSSFKSFFGLVFSCIRYLCTGSSFRIVISASGIVILLFCLSYVFCCICWTTFGTTDSFRFNKLSRSFLSVIDVIKFDKSNSALKSGKSFSFSNSNNFAWWSSEVSVSVSFAQKNLLVSCV